MAHHMSMRLVLPVAVIALALGGCTTKKENPDELRQKTAQTTAELKREAQAVAQGVREGWNRDKLVNLNTASKSQLMELPGITSERADKIIAERPYRRADELVTRGILPKSEYDKISGQVMAGK
jgi:competence protein ComEA